MRDFSRDHRWLSINTATLRGAGTLDRIVGACVRHGIRAISPWRDQVHAIGLERTGRIVTAAAVVMCAAFSGFVAGRIVGLQEFGIGLAVAIFVDATLIRALLVPSLMALFGRYNWWLPRPLARVVRVPPSPLEPPRAALRPAGR